MIKNSISCIKVSDTAMCPNCRSKFIIKNGYTKYRKQQYYCKNCGKRSIDYYSYQKYFKFCYFKRKPSHYLTKEESL